HSSQLAAADGRQSERWRMVQAIDNIGICTTDLTRSVTFYERLGRTEAYRNDRGVGTDHFDRLCHGGVLVPCSSASFDTYRNWPWRCICQRSAVKIYLSRPEGSSVTETTILRTTAARPTSSTRF